MSDSIHNCSICKFLVKTFEDIFAAVTTKNSFQWAGIAMASIENIKSSIAAHKEQTGHMPMVHVIFALNFQPKVKA